MKIRILWVQPAERHLQVGKVYDLTTAEAAHLVSVGEAEPVAKDEAAEADPRPKSQVAEPSEARADQETIRARVRKLTA